MPTDQLPTDPRPPLDPWQDVHALWTVRLYSSMDDRTGREERVYLASQVDAARAAERQQSTAQFAEKDAEIATLKRDVAFKDSLIWTSRESELYKATVAAEKAQKRAEADVASLTHQLAEVRRDHRIFSEEVAKLAAQLDQQLKISADYGQVIETQRQELVKLRAERT